MIDGLVFRALSEINSYKYEVRLAYHIEAWIKWRPFNRRHFQMNCFTEVSYIFIFILQRLVAFVAIMDRCWPDDKPIPRPSMDKSIELCGMAEIRTASFITVEERTVALEIIACCSITQIQPDSETSVTLLFKTGKKTDFTHVILKYCCKFMSWNLM